MVANQAANIFNDENSKTKEKITNIRQVKEKRKAMAEKKKFNSAKERRRRRV